MSGCAYTWGVQVEPPHVMSTAAWERMNSTAPALHSLGQSASATSKQFANLSRALEQSRNPKRK